MSAAIYDPNEKPHSPITEKLVRWTVFSMLGALLYLRYIYPLFRLHKTMQRMTGREVTEMPAAESQLDWARYGADLGVVGAVFLCVWLTCRALKYPRISQACVFSVLCFLTALVPPVLSYRLFDRMLPLIAKQGSLVIMVPILGIGLGCAVYGLYQLIKKSTEARYGYGWGLCGLALNGVFFAVMAGLNLLPIVMPYLEAETLKKYPDLERIQLWVHTKSATDKDRDVLEFPDNNFRLLAPGVPWQKTAPNEVQIYGKLAEHLSEGSDVVYGHPARNAVFLVKTGTLSEQAEEDITLLEPAVKRFFEAMMTGADPAAGDQPSTDPEVNARALTITWQGREHLNGSDFTRIQAELGRRRLGVGTALEVDAWIAIDGKSLIMMLLAADVDQSGWLGGEARKVASSFSLLKGKALAARKPEAEILHQKALRASARRDYAAACDLAKQAFEISANDPKLLIHAVQSLIDLEQTAAAVGYLEQYGERFVGDPFVQLLQAKLWADAGKWQQAAPLYEQLLTLGYGSEDDVRSALGCLSAGGETQRALDLADTLVIKRPFPKLRRWRASLQAEVGDYASALPTLQSLALAVPFDPVDAWRLGEIALRAHQHQLALEAVQQLRESGYDTPRTKVIFARALIALNQLDQAQEAIKLAAKEAPQDPGVLAAKAELSKAQSNPTAGARVHPRR